ncbi:RNA polymerase sigma factor [Roseovarius sp. CAU 1744]|uniref:RNA polymerase sigma factor n=1 Tax=Roseovarius sp. CAU 1744 TaxID=3140368 RepID=UPI00325C07B1
MPLDSMSEESDEALLLRYAAGDQAAARALTLRLTPRAYAHACRMLGIPAEAEDVTQDALMRLWRVAPDWRPGEALVTTWLYRVVANLCTDRLRRARGVALEAVPEPEDDQVSAPERLQQQSRAAALQAALNRLPERQRQAVILRHIDGLSNPQIAEIMEIGVEAVESLTARGKRALTADLVGKRDELGYTDG